MLARARRPAARAESIRGATPDGSRPWASPARSMSRAVPRAARARRRLTFPWWARADATAWCATARRGSGPNAWSIPPILRRCCMADPRAYIRDGAEIYRRSFAIIRAESDLARFSALEERVAVRIIHACGMTEIARDIA